MAYVAIFRVYLKGKRKVISITLRYLAAVTVRGSMAEDQAVGL